MLGAGDTAVPNKVGSFPHGAISSWEKETHSQGQREDGERTPGTALPLLASDPQGLVPFSPGAQGGEIGRMRGPLGSQMLCLSLSQISALGNWKHT